MGPARAAGAVSTTSPILVMTPTDVVNRKVHPKTDPCSSLCSQGLLERRGLSRPIDILHIDTEGHDSDVSELRSSTHLRKQSVYLGLEQLCLLLLPTGPPRR